MNRIYGVFNYQNRFFMNVHSNATPQSRERNSISNKPALPMPGKVSYGRGEIPKENQNIVHWTKHNIL